jgi:hypothetical protein
MKDNNYEMDINNDRDGDSDPPDRAKKRSHVQKAVFKSKRINQYVTKPFCIPILSRAMGRVALEKHENQSKPL